MPLDFGKETFLPLVNSRLYYNHNGKTYVIVWSTGAAVRDAVADTETVVRAAPCLFGLYSVVAVLYHLLPEAKRSGRVAWAGKDTVTFSDALTAVRRRVWADGVFPQAKVDGAIAELPANVRELLLSGLAPAP